MSDKGGRPAKDRQSGNEPAERGAFADGIAADGAAPGDGADARADRTAPGMESDARADRTAPGAKSDAGAKADGRASEAAAEADNATDSREDEAATGAEDSAESGSDDADAKYMRLAADFQNYKKRTEKERFERYAEGKKDLASDILPVLDNFERAVSDEMRQDRAVAEGLEMILKQLRDALAKNGVTEIEALGADFDPNLHHAVAMDEPAEYESGKVCEVLQKGYAAGDKIIRPAMVKVVR